MLIRQLCDLVVRELRATKADRSGVASPHTNSAITALQPSEKTASFSFCGNTVTHHELRLRWGSNLVLTCGDVLRDPDNRGDRRADGPDARFSCRKCGCGRCPGAEQQRRERGQGG